MPRDRRWFSPPLYGLPTYGDIFTPRQLVALTTFSDLVGEATKRVRHDAAAAGLPDDGRPLRDGGTGARAYAEAVAVYLGMGISRFADRNNSLCTWDSGPAGTRATTGGSARTASLRNLFARQAIPMAWDYGEANPFCSDSGGGYSSSFGWIEPVPFASYSVLFSEQPTSLTPHLKTAAMTESYPPTRRTTTTSATLTCRTSSTSGSAAP